MTQQEWVDFLHVASDRAKSYLEGFDEARGDTYDCICPGEPEECQNQERCVEAYDTLRLLNLLASERMIPYAPTALIRKSPQSSVVGDLRAAVWVSLFLRYFDSDTSSNLPAFDELTPEQRERLELIALVMFLFDSDDGCTEVLYAFGLPELLDLDAVPAHTDARMQRIRRIVAPVIAMYDDMNGGDQHLLSNVFGEIENWLGPDRADLAHQWMNVMDATEMDAHHDIANAKIAKVEAALAARTCVDVAQLTLTFLAPFSADPAPSGIAGTKHAHDDETDPPAKRQKREP